MTKRPAPTPPPADADYWRAKADLLKSLASGRPRTDYVTVQAGLLDEIADAILGMLRADGR